MVMTELENKYKLLQDDLIKLEKVAVAFSGGVDSTLLLAVAHNMLGNNLIAITARSLSFPERELTEAKAFTNHNNIEHIIVDIEELKIEGFTENPPNRCYLCKKEIFNKIKQIALQKGVHVVAEGSNIDDDGDFRPGHLAIKELGIKSPLREAGMSKDDVRRLSAMLELPTRNKQSFACLATRIPYGETITAQKLQMVDKAEQLLLDLGFSQVRVRHHGNLARIEVGESEIGRLLESRLRNEVYNKFKKYGFTYISLDLKGYRTGSMNETITSLFTQNIPVSDD